MRSRSAASAGSASWASTRASSSSSAAASGRARGQDLADGALVAGHQLVQVGDARAAAQRDRAGVGVLVAGEHRQQRRLARAVGADQADARPRAELEVGAVEDQAAAEGLHDAAQRERGGGGGGDGHGGLRR